MRFDDVKKAVSRIPAFCGLLLLTGITVAAAPELSADRDVAHARIELPPNSSPPDVNETGLFRIPLIGTLTDVGFRIASVDGSKFDNLTQQAFFFDFALPATWSPWSGAIARPRLTVEVGRFHTSFEYRAFASFGPAVRLIDDRWRVPAFVDFGFSPTVIDGSRYSKRDLGTSLNFTSHVALGLRFGQHRTHSVSLRYQHISNGGINNTNPGVNMVGLDFVFWGIAVQ
jgi:hypothetical protein